MKLARYAIFAALCAGLSACTSVTTDTAQTWPASPDYTAHGTLLGVKAYDYGKVTVVELPENGSVVVKDAQGRKVKTERVGQFVRFPSMSHFVVESGGRSTTFTAPVRTVVFATPQSAVSEAEKITAQPGDDDVKALLVIAEGQLKEARELLRKSPENTMQATLRLNAAEDALMQAASAVVRVGFAYGSSSFQPSQEVGRVLIASGIAATSVNVRGYTDSNNAGKLDAKIALARAMSARKFLIEGGVSAEKIKVDSFASGHHVVPNAGQGRDVNRRVEIEFKNPRISDLASLPVKVETAPLN